MKKQSGFSIIEYMVSMVVLLAVFAIVFQVFIPIARSAKTESNNIQTQIEGIIGLELLRRDVVHAGVGLPWLIPSGTSYSESSDSPQDNFNDDDMAGISVAPRAIIAVDGDSTDTPPPVEVADSDYLVLKATAIADVIQPGGTGTSFVNNPAVDRWTTVYKNGVVRSWGTTDRDPDAADQVIVVQPTASSSSNFALGVDGSGNFTTTFGTNGANMVNFAPTSTTGAYYVFGVSSDTGAVNMPFNRADYYISLSNVPGRCALNTGVLVKRVLNQDGTFSDPIPLLDCVADFQVALGVDNLVNKVSQRNCLTNPSDDNLASATLFPTTTPPDAAQVRAAFKEVRIYVLAQEGAIDQSYRFRNFVSGTSIRVGEANTSDCDPGGTANCDCTGADGILGHDFDMAASGITDPAGTTGSYVRYRWRVYKMVIKPEGLVTTSAQ